MATRSPSPLVLNPETNSETNSETKSETLRETQKGNTNTQPKKQPQYVPLNGNDKVTSHQTPGELNVKEKATSHETQKGNTNRRNPKTKQRKLQRKLESDKIRHAFKLCCDELKEGDDKITILAKTKNWIKHLDPNHNFCPTGAKTIKSKHCSVTIRQTLQDYIPLNCPLNYCCFSKGANCCDGFDLTQYIRRNSGLLLSMFGATIGSTIARNYAQIILESVIGDKQYDCQLEIGSILSFWVKTIGEASFVKANGTYQRNDCITFAPKIAIQLDATKDVLLVLSASLGLIGVGYCNLIPSPHKTTTKKKRRIVGNAMIWIREDILESVQIEIYLKRGVTNPMTVIPNHIILRNDKLRPNPVVLTIPMCHPQPQCETATQFMRSIHPNDPVFMRNPIGSQLILPNPVCHPQTQRETATQFMRSIHPNDPVFMRNPIGSQLILPNPVCHPQTQRETATQFMPTSCETKLNHNKRIRNWHNPSSKRQKLNNNNQVSVEPKNEPKVEPEIPYLGVCPRSEVKLGIPYLGSSLVRYEEKPGWMPTIVNGKQQMVLQYPSDITRDNCPFLID
eukprot:91469_1